MVFVRGTTSIVFAENQLFPGLIGLSPLNTTHPRIFQHSTVRPSSACYRTFSLVMPRSPGFGSNASNSVALFRLAFAAPTPIGLSLLDTLSHRPIMQEVRSHPSKGLLLFVSIRFQVLFHSPHRGAFHLSLTVLVRYRSCTSI